MRVCPRTQRYVEAGPCGTTVDRYEIERLLAEGGMGAVYLARHRVLRQAVALKLLRPELASKPETLARFVQEARAAAMIGAPEIVRVSDVGTTPDGTVFLVMEYLIGKDLEQILGDERVLSTTRAVHLAGSVLDGLAAAHDASIVHRDVKPANVLVLPGNPERIKLLDFGISKFLEAAQTNIQTRAGVILGTPAYMAPEQVLSAATVDHRADLYAVAAMLYRMLSGSLPFEGRGYEEQLLKLCTEQPRPLSSIAPHLPPSLIAIIDQGIQRDPAHRWQSARSFAQALRALGTARTSVLPQVASLGFASTQPIAQSSLPGSFSSPPTPTPSPYVASSIASVPPQAHSPSVRTPTVAIPNSSIITPTSLMVPGVAVPAPSPPASAPVPRLWILLPSALCGMVVATCGWFVLGGEHFANVEEERPAVTSAAAGITVIPAVNALSPTMAVAPAPVLSPMPVFAAPMPPANVVQTPTPAPVVASATTNEVVVFGEPRVVGGVDTARFRAHLERAQQAVLQCRRAGRPFSFTLRALVNGRTSPLLRSAEDELMQDETVHCVLNRLREAGPMTVFGDGIVHVSVHLPARAVP